MKEHSEDQANQPSPHSLQTHQIDLDRAGQRLDNYLIARTKLPKSLIYNLLRRGKIRVDKAKKEPSYRLEEDDSIAIPLQYISEENKTPAQKVFKQEQIEWLDDCIVEENEHFIIFNKPAGLASHGGSGHSFGLIELLRQRRPHKTLELIHRLDKDTSGLMVIAKKRSALRDINELFAHRDVQKYYLAILSGVCRHKETVKHPLGITRHNGIRVAFVDYKEGLASETVFVPISRYAGKSLCLAMPRTGRMHQIRAHSASMDLPIVGDEVYNGEKADRLYLHSARLAFRYLETDWVFEQNPPDYWDKEFFKGWDLWKTINRNAI